MKYLSLALLVLTTYLPLYLMDGKIKLDDKTVQKLTECMKTCSAKNLSLSSCIDNCTKIHKCDKLPKEQVQALVAQTLLTSLENNPKIKELENSRTAY